MFKCRLYICTEPGALTLRVIYNQNLKTHQKNAVHPELSSIYRWFRVCRWCWLVWWNFGKISSTDLASDWHQERATTANLQPSRTEEHNKCFQNQTGMKDVLQVYLCNTPTELQDSFLLKGHLRFNEKGSEGYPWWPGRECLVFKIAGGKILTQSQVGAF